MRLISPSSRTVACLELHVGQGAGPVLYATEATVIQMGDRLIDVFRLPNYQDFDRSAFLLNGVMFPVGTFVYSSDMRKMIRKMTKKG